MRDDQPFVATAVLALLSVMVALVPASGRAHQAGVAGHQHDTKESDTHAHGSAAAPGAHAHGPAAAAGAHVHVPVADEYRSAHVPAAAWTSPGMIARGKEIYASRCAVCHGERGDGKGPAAAGLALTPPDLRAAAMVGEMPGNYWFWRISEGGLVEPFRSQGSTMPAWKDVLPVEDRWAVIAYQHTFSGHAGPHVTSEHPRMPPGGHRGDEAQHGAEPQGAPTVTPGPAGHKH